MYKDIIQLSRELGEAEIEIRNLKQQLSSKDSEIKQLQDRLDVDDNLDYWKEKLEKKDKEIKELKEERGATIRQALDLREADIKQKVLDVINKTSFSSNKGENTDAHYELLAKIESLFGGEEKGK